MAEHRSRRGPATYLNDADARRIMAWLRSTIALVDIVHGLGYLLGAPASAPSLVLMQQFVPMSLWGAALILAGVLVFIRASRPVGMAIGGFVMLVWAGFSAVVLAPVVGMPATGWGWAPYAGFAVLHIVGTWFNSTAATRRR